MNMRSRILAILLVGVTACSNKQEPIFHLFEHSMTYPDYDEISYLKSVGFKEAKIGDTLWLAKSGSLVDLKFATYKTEVIEKWASITITEFDTLLATELIEKRFGGRKTTRWNTFLPNDSVYSTLVEYKDDFYVVTLDSLSGKVLLGTRNDLFHRAVRD
jgi:hypothetical protein